MADHIWRQIDSLLASAKDRVLLIAPFIKVPIFEAALAAIPAHVADVTCITRWSAEEVAAGVSDPEIIDVAKADGRPVILLCHNLHAKIYISDQQCLVGSANLTGKATGRIGPANIELLVATDTIHPAISAALQEIKAQSVLATAAIAAEVRARADLLTSNGMLPFGRESAGDTSARWYPVTRAPERLYRVYLGDSTGCTYAVLEGALTDLAHLDIPPGLNEREFREAVLQRIYLFPEVNALERSGQISSTELESALLTSGTNSSVNAAERALTLTRWLIYFDTLLHTVPAGPYNIVRGQQLT